MKLKKYLGFAVAGWFSAVFAIILTALVWPSIFPAIIQTDHYYGEGPSLASIVWMAILFASPFALTGGLIGSRIPREGGASEQYIMAALAGIGLSLPFACYGLWLFTGW
jgi:hypothetical protein